MNKIHAILENLHINEEINARLLDRFILYCRAANVKHITYAEDRGDYWIAGIQFKRFEPLVKSFIKANNDSIIFDYKLSDGVIEVKRLETKTK
jgi:hypothetical protein